MAPVQRDQHEPVAIVGMGCRWPGGARDASQFWEFLREKTDGWKEFDNPRFSTKGFHLSKSDRPGTFSMKGAFLAEEDARLFDHTFFGMTAHEVETLDPSQRKLLEVSYEAIENAGETWDSVSGTRTGVFVGNFCLDHWMIQSRDWDNPRPYAFTCAGTSILANRISYIFNLQGPSLTVDTACSSSMYALHLAVNAIRAGDCDSAIVASANWIADPGVQIALDKLGALSASSRCHTFDARAEDVMAIPASHIISSPSATRLRRATEMTRKGGFDVILSTAQGESLRSTLQVLATLGHIIDVGRVDAQNSQPICLELFQKNANYCSVDPSIILDSDPSLDKELMRAVDSYCRKGLIGPIPRVVAPAVAQLSQVLANFSNMIGKLVVTFTNPESLVRMIPPAPTVNFDPEACYVITGALSGLGQTVIRWMGDRGARHMVLLSRRDITSDSGARLLVESQAGRDIDFKGIICDVSNKDQVKRVIQQISSSRPIKGIVHTAVSYQDLTFDKLSPSQWNEGLSAKVDGTKNLHEATLSMPLDFFVMPTSALSVYAFVRHRKQKGLPASTVSFSLIRDITKVGTDAITMDLFERNKTLTLGESQFLTLLEPAFLNNKTAAETSSEQWFGQRQDPLSAANLHTYLDPAGMMVRKREEIEGEGASSTITPRWYGDGRVSLIMRAFSDAQRQSAHLQGSSDGGSKDTVAHLRRAFDAAVQAGSSGCIDSIAFVQSAIANAVAEMLFVDVESVDVTKSVADQGVDSLIAAELRSWFYQALGTNISMLDLLDPNVGIGMLAGKITDEALAARA